MTPEYWEAFFRPPALPSPWKGSLKHFVLLGLTAVSIYWVGVYQYRYTSMEGLRFVAAVLAIMLSHEMGHYVACRIYRVDATLPFFIPFPIHLVGTFGAFIRIRSAFPDRKALFDIGIAGPLAGFAVCIPVLFLGLQEARLVPTASAGGGELGEPLLFSWAAAWLLRDVPDGMSVLLGPLGLAAWFGLLLTALNMMPIGQLDGGHVTYAMLRGGAHYITRAGLLAALVLAYHWPSWVLWAILLLVLARRHPPTLDDSRPLGTPRAWIGLLGFVVFAVSFTPNPIHVGWSDMAHAGRELFAWATSR